MLRSGAYSDEVVQNLANRRFVAFFYDLAPPTQNSGDAWAYDKDAVQALGDFARIMRGRTAANGSEGRDGRVRADGYPAMLLFTPKGDRIGEGLWGVPPPELFVAAMRAAAAAAPEFFLPLEAERAALANAAEHQNDPVAQLAAARLHWELAEFDATRTAVAAGLAASPSAVIRYELLYLRGRAEQCLHMTDEALATLADVITGEHVPADLHDAALVAAARCHLRAGRNDKALELLDGLLKAPRGKVWIGTAMYFTGLARFRLGDVDGAKAIWRRHREELPHDRLARRSAASLGIPEVEAFRNQQLFEVSGWW